MHKTLLKETTYRHTEAEERLASGMGFLMIEHRTADQTDNDLVAFPHGRARQLWRLPGTTMQSPAKGDTKMFAEMKADYVRHGSSVKNPALWAVWNYRFGVWVLTVRIPGVRWLLSKWYGLNLFVILLTSGIRLYRETKIGSGFHLIHSGNIAIHPRTVIGDRCGIQQDVTIGTNMGSGVPTIGNDVFIGAGAKVLGGITIGDGAVIAANSLVINDVPPGAMAIGVPARMWKHPAKERQSSDDSASS